MLWDTAYSDEFLEVHEERIIRRIADLIMIKDVRVLRLKDDSKNLKFNLINSEFSFRKFTDSSLLHFWGYNFSMSL